MGLLAQLQKMTATLYCRSLLNHPKMMRNFVTAPLMEESVIHIPTVYKPPQVLASFDADEILADVEITTSVVFNP